MAQQKIKAQNYVYTLSIAALAGGGVAQTSVNIDADSRFHWVKGAYFADIAAAAQTDSTRVVPLITVQLTDTGSGRNFFDAPVPISSYFGTGELPFIMPVVQMFDPNSTIKAEFTNFDAASTYNLRLQLIGFKEFR